MLKKILRKFYILISKMVLSIFYDKRYFEGKWFDEEILGWHWSWRCLIDQKIKGYNRHIRFPVNPTTTIGRIENLTFDINNIDNFWKNGCYFQCWNGKIEIGKGTWIAQNVGIITENHQIQNLSQHETSKDVKIGNNCWIGMNSVLLPGVHLGDHTIVAAGAVVTHSFKEGNCVLAGVPAKKIKNLINEKE